MAVINRGSNYKYKICRIVYPGDTYTYADKYLTKEEYEEMTAQVLMVLTLLERKGKEGQVEQVARLRKTYELLKGLL